MRRNRLVHHCFDDDAFPGSLDKLVSADIIAYIPLLCHLTLIGDMVARDNFFSLINAAHNAIHDKVLCDFLST